MAYSRPAWHSKSEVNEAVSNFYHKYARQPDSSEAKQILLRYLAIIRGFLEGKGVPCQGFQFVGSTYEGLKVDDGLEFDVFVILDGHGFDVTGTHAPDYCLIRPRSNVSRPYFESALTHDGYVDSGTMARKFQGYMDQLYATNYEIQCGGQVKFRKHGPAIQMDVNRYGQFWFSVDLVPTYAIGGQYYVAKPRGTAAWLHSFSVEMKDMFDGIDRSNTRRKQVLRTMKVLCHREPTLKVLSSHHLKMLLLSELKENPYKGWGPHELALRLLDLLERLEQYLTRNNYPHYFLPAINMIQQFQPAVVTRNMKDRVHNLYNSETAFMKVMRS